MAYNKIEANGETLIDLTSDTVTADTLLSGRTAHLANGEKVTGTFEPVTGVKGNAETNYRTGNVNLTPANIGAATSAQGKKADSAVQTIIMNGDTATKTSGGIVDLGTVITAHQNISGKADKSATVSTVTYDTTNKKLTKTINGTTTDVVTTAKLKTDMALSKSDVGLGNVGNFKAVSTAASQDLTDAERSNARKNIRLGNVDNTSDLNKPISTATQTALDDIQEQIDKALEQTGYNLLPITIESQTINGVTFTVDKANGTITANGTHTGTIASIISEYINLPAGTYSYTNSGNVEARNSTGDSLIQLNNTTIARGNANDSPGNIFKLDSDSSIRVAFRTSAGYNPSNYIFKPMIVPVELAGVPFQSYAKSNAELTRYTDDIQEQIECIDIKAAYVPATGEVHLTNTSDFTQQLFSKLYVHDEVRFAVLHLSVTSSTYHIKAIINTAAITHATAIEATFINDDTLYKFYWTSNGTPTLTRKTLSFV